MSLPAFIRWSLASLYPSGANPWSSSATKTAPPYNFYTPGVPSGAQEDNFILHSLGEQSSLVASVPLGQLTPTETVSTLTGGGSTTLDQMAYNEGGGLWFAVTHSTPNLLASPDNGSSWTSVATPASQVNAMGFFSPLGAGNNTSYTPLSGVLILGGSNNVFFYNAASGALVDSGSSQGVTFNSGGVAFGLPTSTAAVFGFSYDGTNHRTRCFACTGSVSYTALTLPTAWQNGPQTNITYFTYGIGPSLDALVAWGGTTPGTDTSYILHMSAASFPTTPTFTALTLPSGMSGNSITGVAYNPTTGQYGAMVYDGTNSALWTTADLTTWTQQTVLTGLFAGLVNIGPYWVTTAERGDVPGATSYAPIYSFDGITWKRGAGTGITSRPQLAAGPGCIALWSTGQFMVSQTRIQ